ncbi:histidine kinase [Thermosporothrix hazakensis]|uniref:Histidine kinase n=2 Tax=Thermosporothrix TaxID=768650 RepID=A0A326UDZ7_THEHA|nr:ATP-binding protein [Thermosporothrix hazakensis]PZW32964.1 histidine kinase [Thermosporothrix hazakensis]BBH90946.1 hypothetical protein KTC_56970 [Thermosporothrix sp. COM3]GCE48996.1 hypothetical protein KTH_38650 [Thermosporothrix hazakensis]
MSFMKTFRKLLKAFPGSTGRRLRTTPGYFFLVWRWSMWLYALILLVGSHANPVYTQRTGYKVSLVLLGVTFIQTLIVTLYAPIIQPLLPALRLPRFLQGRKLVDEDEDENIFTPLGNFDSPTWRVGVHVLDLVICGMATYLSGPFSPAPNFGTASPFYRYGISTAFAAALSYRYRGGIATALGYDLFIILGIFFPPYDNTYHANVIDITGSLIDAPVAATLAAFVVSLLSSYTQNLRNLQASFRIQRAQLRIGEILLQEAHDKKRLIQQSIQLIRLGGHFHRVLIALIHTPEQGSAQAIAEVYENSDGTHHLPPVNEELLEHVLRHKRILNTFTTQTSALNGSYKISRLYIPITKEGSLQLILGAESRRRTPLAYRYIDYLKITGNQLLTALENIRLTEQTVQLAAIAERRRIAREIHDGVAQHIYILSIHAETCVAQAQNIMETSASQAEMLSPLVARLKHLVTISKQALWETRTYMFSLKPLLSGTTTLTQMISNQLSEFETISGLRTQLTIENEEQEAHLRERDRHAWEQTSTATFRIVQEALTNAYKHAEASTISVSLCYDPDTIEVTISDNGKGMKPDDDSADRNGTPIYSGHGLNSMRERAEEVGGTLTMRSSPNGGVQIWLCLPVSPERRLSTNLTIQPEENIHVTS